MQRVNRPKNLQQVLLFGSRSVLKTPLVPYSATKTVKSSAISSPFDSDLNSSLPSPRNDLQKSILAFRIRIFTIIFGTFNFWTLFYCKFAPKSDFVIIRIFQNDHFYCYFIPVQLLTLWIFMLLNWLGMKYFKHNA